MGLRSRRCFSQRTLLLASAFGCGDPQGTTSALIGDGGRGAASAGSGSGSAGAASRAGAAGYGSGGAAAAGAGGQTNGDAGAAGSAAGPGGSSSEPASPRLGRYHDTVDEPSLRFELDAVEGLAPYPSSLDYLGDFVGRALGKPAGISFDADETLPPTGSAHAWTFDELDAFSRQHAQDDSDGPVSIHVLFIDGSYDSAEGGGSVLGLAWGARHIALFQEAIRSGCSGGLLAGLSSESCAIAERNVWAHEIGHVVGLVENGLVPQTDHRDTEHGRHDVSDACLMYWAYDRPAIFDVLLSRLGSGQSADVDFCENCWADLDAARR